MTIRVPAAGPLLFQGRANAVQTTANTANTSTPVALALEDFDDANGHSTSSNTSRYTPGQAGVYSLSGLVLVAAGDATTGGTTIRVGGFMKNGTAIATTQNWQTYNGGLQGIPVGPTLVTLTATDYVEMYLFSQLASTRLAGDSSSGSWFRVDLVR